MMIVNYKNISLFFSLFLIAIAGFSQVGIGTTDPTNSLDVDGDLRVRQIPNSDSTDDLPLVVDSNGEVKKQLSAVRGKFRGILGSNFSTSTSTPNAQNIYKVNTIDEFIDRGNDFNDATDSFVAPVDGAYEVLMTLTVRGSAPDTNYVCGLTGPTGEWVIRFSMDATEVNNAPFVVGTTYTFAGLTMLTAGEAYSFGVAPDNFTIISNPNGATGTGNGTYFKISLIDN